MGARFWNATFRTAVGTYAFDETEEVKLRFDISQLNEETGAYEVGGTQNASRRFHLYLVSVEQPVLRTDEHLTQLVELKGVKWWLGDKMPLDLPPCGYGGHTGPCVDVDGKQIVQASSENTFEAGQKPVSTVSAMWTDKP